MTVDRALRGAAAGHGLVAVVERADDVLEQAVVVVLDVDTADRVQAGADHGPHVDPATVVVEAVEHVLVVGARLVEHAPLPPIVADERGDPRLVLEHGPPLSHGGKWVLG